VVDEGSQEIRAVLEGLAGAAGAKDQLVEVQGRPVGPRRKKTKLRPSLGMSSMGKSKFQMARGRPLQ
jgi:hypothetical protein